MKGLMSLMVVGAGISIYAILDKKLEVVETPTEQVERTEAQSSNKPKASLKIKSTHLVLPVNRSILLQGAVGENAILAAEKLNMMQLESQDPIYVVLIGPGGSVLTGNTLIAAMQASRAPVYTICTTICASMDAVIHQYGKKRFVTDKTVLMFHPASTASDGDVDKMYSYIRFIKLYVDRIEKDIAKRWNIPFDVYKNIISNELWIDAEDAIQNNIADGLVSFSFNVKRPEKLPVYLKIQYPFTKQPQQPASPKQIKDFDIQWVK